MLRAAVGACTLRAMEAPSRPYHHGNLRAALLAAGERALENGGVQNLSLRELSRELGVSHTSPRRHFADKQALLDALAQHGFERLGTSLGRAAKGKPEDFESRLTKVGRGFVAFAREHPALLSLMLTAKHRSGAPRELIEEGERSFAHTLAIFTEGQAAGVVIPGDPHRLALVAFAALQGLVTLSTNGKLKDVPVEKFVGEVVSHLVQGLRPR